MIELKTEREIIDFDGRIINRYHSRGISIHFHIDWVESVEINSDRKGRRHWLQFNLFAGQSDSISTTVPQLSPENMPQAQAFVDEVMRAIASRRG